MNEKQLNRLFCNNAGHHLIFYSHHPFCPQQSYLRERIRWVKHFFEKLLRYYQEERNLMSEWMKWETIKPILQDIATTHFAPNSPTFEKEFAESASFREINMILPRRTQSYEQMNENTILTIKPTLLQQCRIPPIFYSHHPFCPQQSYLRERIRWVSIFSKNY